MNRFGNFKPIQEFVVSNSLFKIYKAKELDTTQWISDDYRQSIENIRRSYLRYGQIDLIDEYDNKAAVFMCQVTELANKAKTDELDSQSELFTIRFVPAFGKPSFTEDLDLFVCAGEKVGNLIRDRVLLDKSDKDYLQDVITISRIAGIVGHQFGKEFPDCIKLKNSATAFVLMNYIFFTEYYKRYKILTAILREEIFFHYINNINELFNYNLSFPLFNQLLEFNNSDLKLQRNSTVYKYPAYFLNAKELLVLIKELYDDGVLSSQTLSQYIHNFTAETFFDMDVSRRDLVYRLVGLGNLIGVNGTIEFSNISGEEIRAMIDNRVSDGPRLHAIMVLDWKKQLDQIVNSLK